jgi:NADPH:quinone reductase
VAPRLLERIGYKVSDIDLCELNEPFACQVLYCHDQLDIPDDRLNVNGGVVAVGHPYGANIGHSGGVCDRCMGLSSWGDSQSSRRAETGLARPDHATGNHTLVPPEYGCLQGSQDRRVYCSMVEVRLGQDLLARVAGSGEQGIRTAGRAAVKALVSRQAGGPETLVLEDLPEPSVGPGQVRIAVRACAVNFPDLLIIQDLYQVKPERPFAPGAEAAGIVDAVGAGVETVRPGDRVLISPVHGGMAEKAVGAAINCWKIPDVMPFDEAAALLMTYGTSQHALKDRAQLRSGETLLVLGAGGGVGLAAVELGRATTGARVVAAASSEAKLALARERGADACVQYPVGALDKSTARTLTEQLKAACGVDGAHVIYDPVGGDYTEAALRAIAWQGRHLVVDFPAGIPKLPLNLPLLKGCQVMGVFWGEIIRRFPILHAANVTALMELYRDGRIKPAITERFSLARGAQAIARLAAREARGKMVVLIP